MLTLVDKQPCQMFCPWNYDKQLCFLDIASASTVRRDNYFLYQTFDMNKIIIASTGTMYGGGEVVVGRLLRV